METGTTYSMFDHKRTISTMMVHAQPAARRYHADQKSVATYQPSEDMSWTDRVPEICRENRIRSRCSHYRPQQTTTDFHLEAQANFGQRIADMALASRCSCPEQAASGTLAPPKEAIRAIAAAVSSAGTVRTDLCGRLKKILGPVLCRGAVPEADSSETGGWRGSELARSYSES